MSYPKKPDCPFQIAAAGILGPDLVLFRSNGVVNNLLTTSTKLTTYLCLKWRSKSSTTFLCNKPVMLMLIIKIEIKFTQAFILVPLATLVLMLPS